MFVVDFQQEDEPSLLIAAALMPQRRQRRQRKPRMGRTAIGWSALLLAQIGIVACTTSPQKLQEQQALAAPTMQRSAPPASEPAAPVATPEAATPASAASASTSPAAESRAPASAPAPPPTEPRAPASTPAPPVSSSAPLPPPYRSNVRPRFPLVSRLMGEQGTTRLQVCLTNAIRRPVSVVVTDSSGFERLDQAAFNAVQEWNFIPAARDGEPVAECVFLPIRWILHSGGPG